MNLLEFEELASAVVFSFIAALYYASSARWHFSEVPWTDFFRNPFFFGGRRSQWRGIGFFLAWYLLTALIWIPITLLVKVKLIAPYSYFADYTYATVHWAIALIALIALNTPSFSLYLLVVNRTKRILRKYGPALSHDIIERYTQDIGEGHGNSLVNYIIGHLKGLFSSYRDANKTTRARPIKFILDWYPLVLASFYKPFYDYYGTVASGCSSLLLHKYGPNTIIDFCDNYILTNPTGPLMTGVDPAKLENINTLFQHKPRIRARSIAYEKVAVHGYGIVDQELHKYVVNRSFDDHQDHGRGTETWRAFVAPYRLLSINNYSRATCIQQGCRRQATLIECGADGSGLYLSPKTRLTETDNVSIRIQGYDGLIRGTIRHSEARYWNEKVISGHGIAVNDENSKKTLAAFANAHEGK